MNIAVRNIHTTGIGGKHPFHDYIIAFLRSEAVTHLFFDDSFPTSEIFCALRSQYSWKDLGLDRVKIIRTAHELESECDVLVSFSSRPEDFSPAVRSFSGTKIYHLMDYFWGEPLSVKIQRLTDYNITYLMSYGSPDRYCDYFKKYGQAYTKKVIPVPFGFGPRFKHTQKFNKRIQKCLALGSVRPLRFENEDAYKFKEQADAFPQEVWFHKFRRLLVENKKELSDVMDSRLPEFPHYRDYDYDQVTALNNYQLFVSDESLFYFPSAKTYEGPATGAVMVCSEHPCFSDYGFRDGENCITHAEFDISDFKRKVKGALADQDTLRKISKKGEEFVQQHYSHEKIGKTLAHIISHIDLPKEGMEEVDMATVSYSLYQNNIVIGIPSISIQPRNVLYWFVYTVFGGVYCIAMYLLTLSKKTLRLSRRILSPIKKKISDGIRSIRNRESRKDAELRKKFLLSNSIPELNMPTVLEKEIIEDLRAGMQALPEATGNPGPESKWALFARTLRANILEKDPRTFLSWEVIRTNMVYRAGLHEYRALKNEPDWDTYWSRALKEPASTLHQPFYLYPTANENSIRQAYHLRELRNLAGKNVADFDTIVDFGGGYGSMARIVREMGFTGTYIIFDWKEFSLLQKFYLSLAGVKLPMTINTPTDLAEVLKTKQGKTLLIATWSLSEVSPELRDSIIEITKPDTLLITYQKEFSGVNNEEYFSHLKKRRSDMRWIESRMKYLPTERNRYLIGTYE